MTLSVFPVGCVNAASRAAKGRVVRMACRESIILHVFRVAFSAFSNSQTARQNMLPPTSYKHYFIISCTASTESTADADSHVPNKLTIRLNQQIFSFPLSSQRKDKAYSYLLDESSLTGANKTSKRDVCSRILCPSYR